MLLEIEASLRRGETFALETTLSGKTYVRLFGRARRLGYALKLFYLWLPSPKVAVARVRERMRKGGHDVPVADVRRRFHRSLANLARFYLPLADTWALFDNSGDRPTLVAESESGRLKVVNPEIFSKLQPTGKKP